MDEINILFLGGGKRVSLAEHFMRAAASLGCKANVLSYELSPYVPISCVGRVLIGKRWKDADLLDDLVETIRRERIKVVLPFVDPAIEKLSELGVHLAQNSQNLSQLSTLNSQNYGGVFIPISELGLCRTMFRKDKSAEWFAAHDIPQPKAVRSEELGVRSSSLFPVIMKPCTGSASMGIKVINNESEWRAVENKESYVIQQYIANSKEYTVDCYVSQTGEVISVVPRERLSVAGGEVVNSITRKDEELIALSHKILRSGAFRGPITIQFIRDLDTAWTYVMEINPRAGGGVITSIEAGVDIPLFILKESLGLPLEPVDDWEDNLLMTRYFKEVIFKNADNY